MILMPPTRSRNYSPPSIEEMRRNGKPWRNSLCIINKCFKKQLIFSTDTVLKFLVIYHHLALFYHCLVMHNRMLNPCHEVNKLLHYGYKHSRLFHKGEYFIRKL